MTLAFGERSFCRSQFRFRFEDLIPTAPDGSGQERKYQRASRGLRDQNFELRQGHCTAALEVRGEHAQVVQVNIVVAVEIAHRPAFLAGLLEACRKVTEVG
jgi:hypothetical protein